MTRWLFGLAVLAVCGAAQAQVYGAPGAGGGFGAGGYGGYGAGGYGGYGGPMMGNMTGAFAPNFYNRAQQPLSPYLNLLNGGNPAVNYFYGTRPGLNPAVASGGAFGFQGSALGPPGLGNRFYLQPPNSVEELPYQPLDAAQPLPGNVIRTAAHPVIFGNGPRIGGGFRSAAGNRTGFGAQQQQQTAPTTPTTPRR